MFFPWSENPQADYVFAAYGVALLALLGLGLMSWLDARAAKQALQKLQPNSK